MNGGLVWSKLNFHVGSLVSSCEKPQKCSLIKQKAQRLRNDILTLNISFLTRKALGWKSHLNNTLQVLLRE